MFYLKWLDCVPGYHTFHFSHVVVECVNDSNIGDFILVKWLWSVLFTVLSVISFE